MILPEGLAVPSFRLGFELWCCGVRFGWSGFFVGGLLDGFRVTVVQWWNLGVQKLLGDLPVGNTTRDILKI